MNTRWFSIGKHIAHALCALFVAANAASAQSATQTASTVPSGVLLGTVLTDKTDRPLMGAEISIPSLRLTTVSDSAGNFRMSGIRRGAHEVVVKRTGFESVYTTFDFSDGEKIAVDFAMPERIIQYAPASARKPDEEDADLRKKAMNERRSRGTGRFISAEDVAAVAKSNPSTAEFLRKKLPALHANKSANDGRALASKEKAPGVEPADADRRSGAKSDCYIRILLNGSLMYEPRAGVALFDVNSIPVRMIQSADFFSAAETPEDTRTEGARCGTLQIWARGR